MCRVGGSSVHSSCSTTSLCHSFLSDGGGGGGGGGECVEVVVDLAR